VLGFAGQLTAQLVPGGSSATAAVLAYAVALFAIVATAVLWPLVRKRYERETFRARLKQQPERGRWREIANAYERNMAERARDARQPDETPHAYAIRVFGARIWDDLPGGPLTSDQCPQLFWY
jgi:hypothetical protein